MTLDTICELSWGGRDTGDLEYCRMLGMAAQDVGLQVPFVGSSVRAQGTRVAAFTCVSHQVVFKVLTAIATLELLPTHWTLKFHYGCCGGIFKGSMWVTLTMGEDPHPSWQLSGCLQEGQDIHSAGSNCATWYYTAYQLCNYGIVKLNSHSIQHI